MTGASEGPAAFVDTNVLVYAYQAEPDRKQIAARRLIRDLVGRGALRTSTQVLQELYYTITRKGESRASSSAALKFIDELAEWPVVVNDVVSLREAARLAERDTLSFWDALIVVAAARSGAARLYTEDMQHGQKLLGIEIVNPFAS